MQTQHMHKITRASRHHAFVMLTTTTTTTTVIRESIVVVVVGLFVFVLVVGGGEVNEHSMYEDVGEKETVAAEGQTVGTSTVLTHILWKWVGDWVIDGREWVGGWVGG